MPPFRHREAWNPLKRLWEQYAPIFHVLGFIILCTFIVATSYNKFSAYAGVLTDHEMRISRLETADTQVNQKLDDIIAYWNVPHKK